MGYSLRISLNAVFCFFLSSIVFAQENSWTNAAGGSWHNAGNWSLGVSPSEFQSATFITNAISKIVNITESTSLNTLSISNLTLSGSEEGINTLSLNESGAMRPLQIFNSLTVLLDGQLVITDSILQVEGAGGGETVMDGLGTLQTGFVDVKTDQLYVGKEGVGTLNLNGGSWFANDVILGSNSTAVGTVLLTGGDLILTNGVSDLLVGEAGTGQLTLSNGTVQVGSDVIIGNTVGSQGTLTVAGGSIELSKQEANGFLWIANDRGSTGTAWVTGGSMVLTNFNSDLFVGDDGSGLMTVSNGTVQVGDDGFVGFDVGSQGILTIAGGSVELSKNNSNGDLVIANNTTSTGSVWLSGGSLVLTNSESDLWVGCVGMGRLTVSNGTVQVGNDGFIGFSGASRGILTVAGGSLLLADSGSDLSVGYHGVGQMNVSSGTVKIGSNIAIGRKSSSVGTLTISGGMFDSSLNSIGGAINIGRDDGATGVVWITGGSFTATNAASELRIGTTGSGVMTVSNGNLIVTHSVVAKNIGSNGIWNSNGGESRIDQSLIIGTDNCTSTGIVSVTSGSLSVTNTTASGVLEVKSGKVLHSGGTIIIDHLVMTNACGVFNQTGGTLTIGTMDLSGGLDADADGLPNDWEQMFNLNPLSDVSSDGANGDPDADGVTNIDEFTGGTDPGIPNAIVIKIIEITRENNDIRITWDTTSGTTNQLQVSAGDVDGFFTSNNFMNLGPQLIIPGSGIMSTNQVDSGAATNFPARFYRIRQIE